jgi:urate oxidase / 2-oxo-4-hydroxy-4-carboxy-5-ureidoimidazoline decarboxylase
VKYEISYGKHEVSFYRARARPLSVPPIPESTFTGRDNLILGGVASVDVFGENFLPSYTEGNNSMVVATDTMKNFVYAQALEYDGATLEGLAAFLARRFVETYPHMHVVRVRIDEVPFESHSDKLASWAAGTDHGIAVADWDADGLRDLQAGRLGMRLVKLTGSAFADFQRDRYTTLPEVRDRPLHIYLGCRWRYTNPRPVVAGGADGLVPSEQVRDHLIHTFDDFVSMSIQHLLHEMGVRLLDRFPQLREVDFAAQNRLWDTSASSERDPQVRVFSNPKPAHGNITLRLTRT